MTPEQQEEFKKAVEHHIQLAVDATIHNMPQPQAPAELAVTINAAAVKAP
jgi:hypothetical protein